MAPVHLAEDLPSNAEGQLPRCHEQGLHWGLIPWEKQANTQSGPYHSSPIPHLYLRVQQHLSGHSSPQGSLTSAAGSAKERLPKLSLLCFLPAAELLLGFLSPSGFSSTSAHPQQPSELG